MVKVDTYRRSLEANIYNIPIEDGRILVTGASGLIGSCIIDLLLLANNFGRNFDIYALGRDKNKLKERFNSHIPNPHLHFIQQDIRKIIDDDIAYKYIIHGASNADPQKYARYPVETMLINIEGAINILNYCLKHPDTKTIMMSSFEVYGKVAGGNGFFTETDNGIVDINKIRSCYPISKQCVEVLARSYVDEYDVNVVIGRLCSIYGPTMLNDDSKASAQFLKNGLNGEDIILKSSGEQRRSYCYVIDAITALLYVLAKGEKGEVYNIANENSLVSIAEFAHIVANLSSKQVLMKTPDKLEQKGYSSPQNSILNNQKLKQLGWEGKYDINQGIADSLEILRKIHE